VGNRGWVVAGELSSTFSALSVEPANVTAEAVKRAEDSDDLIVRLYETDGKTATAVLSFSRTPRSACETDMLEWDKYVAPKSFLIEGTKVKVQVSRHEIKTLRVKF
jgi:alpha-mannosidase